MSPSSHCSCCGQVLPAAKAVVVSLTENRLTYKAQSTPLTPRLAELAFVLARRMPETVSHDAIAAALWGGNECESATNSIKVAVHQLRAVLPDGLVICNTFERGYRLEVVTEMSKSERILRRSVALRQQFNRASDMRIEWENENATA